MKKILKNITLNYLRVLAKLQLKKYAPDIIGITGSAGKSSTLEAVTAVLKDKYQLKVSYKANSEWGIPVNILGLKTNQHTNLYIDWLSICFKAPWQILTYWQPYEKYIVEMGIDSPKPPQNMEYLLSIIRPRTAIFLNVEPMHSEPFDYLVSVKDPKKRRQEIRKVIASEKGKIITSLPENGLGILNQDDDLVINFIKKTKAQTLTFGRDKLSNVRIESTSTSLSGTKIVFHFNDQQEVLHFKQYLLPSHYAYSFAAAICVAIDEDFTLKEAIQLIEKNFNLPPGRSSLIPGIKGSIIIDSSYNASAKPTLDLLQMLSQLGSRKTYALLGDMRELGQETQGEHEEVARLVAKVCTQVFLTGPAMKRYALPLINQKEAGKALWFESASKAADHLKTILKPTDIILIKGSQNTLFLETAVEKLMKDPAKANELLCRRGKFWDERRKRKDYISN
jgi:UDP-N-acetylmuramoyl-tripeptide--D-alanyl-D-alanine ligase